MDRKSTAAATPINREAVDCLVEELKARMELFAHGFDPTTEMVLLPAYELATIQRENGALRLEIERLKNPFHPVEPTMGAILASAVRAGDWR